MQTEVGGMHMRLHFGTSSQARRSGGSPRKDSRKRNVTLCVSALLIAVVAGVIGYGIGEAAGISDGEHGRRAADTGISRITDTAGDRTRTGERAGEAPAKWHPSKDCERVGQCGIA